MYRTSALAFIFLLPALLSARAEAVPRALGLASRQAIDRSVREAMREQQIPGISLAILANGRPIYVASYGVATLEHPVPVQPQTVFQIGSIGKQFTAVAVMLLANEHKLRLDDPLSHYLPKIPASWSEVTLRTILNHQAGIPQWSTPDRQLLDLVHDYTDAQLIHLASGQALEFKPGTDVSYSDTGYVLLGFVINRVAGEFYGDFLSRRVFTPLHMNRTRIISDADIIPDRASGYEMDAAGNLHNQTHVSPALNRTADGSLYSTVLDLALWDRALYGAAILPQMQLQRMWRVDPHRNGQRPLHHFGYGWEDHRLRGHRLIEYDGNWQGFQAVMSRYVDEKLTVILLTNRALCRTERLSHTVAGLVDPALAPYPDSIPDVDPQRTARFGAFLDKTAEGSPVEFLSARGRETLMPSAINTLRRDLKQLGPVLSLSVSQQRDDERVYRVVKKDMVEFFTVRYAPDGSIDELDLLSEY